MSRAPRVDIADLTYHVINRANGRQTIFHSSVNGVRYRFSGRGLIHSSHALLNREKSLRLF